MSHIPTGHPLPVTGITLVFVRLIKFRVSKLRNALKILMSENPEGRNHLGDLTIYKKIILK
jgi:hypothetical protein